MVYRYAKLYYPGAIMAESDVVKVGMKTSAEQVFKEHKDAFQVHFFTRAEIKRKMEKFKGNPVWEKKYYVKGKAFLLKDLKKKFGSKKKSTLVWNVEVNKYPGAVQCHTGNWVVLDTDVVVVP